MKYEHTLQVLDGMNMLQKAYMLAKDAHHGQVDKAGYPYIGHLVRVSNNCSSETLKIIAILHDIVEDTYVTLSDLYDIFPDFIVEAVDALTHHKGESNLEYYYRVKQNGYACIVKVYDVYDNLSPVRLDRMDPEVRERLKKKYLQALDILL